MQNPGLTGTRSDGTAITLLGLPVIAIALQRVSNNTLEVNDQAVLSNYGASFVLRRELTVIAE